MSFSVMLVEDHVMIRAGLRLVLGQIDASIEVCEATTGVEAVALARVRTPDLCLLDISMPDMNGIEAIPLLLKASPATRVLMLSMHSGTDYVSEALRAGAQGYLLKDSAVEELADALRAVREGRPFLSRQIANTLLSEYSRQGTADRGARNPGAKAPVLTPRQREVLQLVAQGRSTKEIAEKLHLSGKTIETHRAEIMRRLDIFDVAGLTRYAVREGLVSLDP